MNRSRIWLVVVFFSLFGTLSMAQTGIQNLSAQEAGQLTRTSKDLVVLDVRTPAEFQSGHIKNALNLDYKAPDFEQQLAKLDKTRPYLVHCAVGGRSTKTLPLLQKLGFKNVRHLDGGIQSWQQAGLPLIK